MNAYGQGQVYSARASATTSCNLGGFYMPQYYPGPWGPNPQPKQFCATHTQTLAPLKQVCDVGTQADLVMEELCAKDPAPGSMDSSDKSVL